MLSLFKTIRFWIRKFLNLKDQEKIPLILLIQVLFVIPVVPGSLYLYDQYQDHSAMKKSIKELAAESPLVKNTNELEYWVLTPMHACDCAHHVDLIKEVYSTTGVELIQYCIDKFKIEQATAWSHRTQQHYKYVTVAPGCPKFDKEKPYYSHRSELNYWSKSYDPNTHCDGVDKDCIVVSSGEAKALRRGSMKQTNKPD